MFVLYLSDEFSLIELTRDRGKTLRESSSCHNLFCKEDVDHLILRNTLPKPLVMGEFDDVFLVSHQNLLSIIKRYEQKLLRRISTLK